ncbi:uncharacterized protein [Watersipora subatra]|uniref:uncharacterized protein n=1 Tax=Watersipora subatra TaxID=2589382 RepID=UPI00355C505E
MHCQIVKFTLGALLLFSYVFCYDEQTIPVCHVEKCRADCKQLKGCDNGRCIMASRCQCYDCHTCKSDEHCTSFCKTVGYDYGQCPRNGFYEDCVCMDDCTRDTYCKLKCRFRIMCKGGVCNNGRCQCLAC